jgi:hypothetical protein
MIKKILIQVSFILFIVSPAFCTNSEPGHYSVRSDSGKKNFGLFDSDEPIEITLRFDMTSYLKKKANENSLKANITFHIGETDSLSRDIKLKTRGIFRNKYCDYSPIELIFDKANFGYDDLDKISKIKLVPECSSGGQNEDYILKEYLVYKIYNILTDTSFRVRLLTINYIDTEKDRKPVKQFGFLIEPLEMLTERTNTAQIKSRMLDQKFILPRIMDRISIFNYMIGNYDWSIPGQHNVKIIKPMIVDTLQLGIGIPYDFDWSGVVNAAYAIPAEKAGVQSVRERIFLGMCRTKKDYQDQLALFLQKKDEIYREINEFTYLNQREKKDITGFLDGFFDQLTGKKDLAAYFMKNCK